jgi:hypothetical protein
VPMRSIGDDSAGFLTLGNQGLPIRANAVDGYAHSSDNVWHYTAPFAPGILMQARRLAPGAASLRFRHAGPMRVKQTLKGHLSDTR